MQRLRYEPVPRMTSAEINSAISRDDCERLVYAVLSAAIYDDDPQWAGNICVRLASHENANVRRNAIMAFGHIARIHRKLNARVKPLIERALHDEDSDVRVQADDTMDDLEHFLKWEFRRTV